MSIQPVRDVLRRYLDERRPVRNLTVLDLSRYSTTGVSYVGVDIGGVLRWAIYQGPIPTIGQTVPVQKMDSGLLAGWLALPSQENVEPITLLFSVFDDITQNGDNSVALVTRAIDRTWSIAAHPIDRVLYDRSALIYTPSGQTKPEGWGDGTALGGSAGNDDQLKARLPLARVADRVFAWMPGWDDLSYADDPGGGVGGPSSFTEGIYLQPGCVNCRVSDDQGVTWADFTDLLAVRQIKAAGLVAWAIHDDGTSLSYSSDGGLTWTLAQTQPTVTPPAFPGGTGYSNPATTARWWTLAIDPIDHYTVTLVDKEGFWTTFDGGVTLQGPMRPNGKKLHFEGDTAFQVSLRPPAYSDYWYDDFPCADVIRLANGSGWVAYWQPSSQRINDNAGEAAHALLGSDDPGNPAGGTITIGQSFHPAFIYLVDFTSRLWRAGSTLYIGTASGYEASVYQSTNGGVTWTVAVPVPSLALNRASGDTRRPGGTGGLVVNGGDIFIAPGSYGFGPGWEGDNAAGTNGPRLWKHSGGSWSIDDDDTFVSSTESFDPGFWGNRLYATFNGGMV